MHINSLSHAHRKPKPSEVDSNIHQDSLHRLGHSHVNDHSRVGVLESSSRPRKESVVHALLPTVPASVGLKDDDKHDHTELLTLLLIQLNILTVT
jgi:hypothetical protein